MPQWPSWCCCCTQQAAVIPQPQPIQQPQQTQVIQLNIPVSNPASDADKARLVTLKKEIQTKRLDLLRRIDKLRLQIDETQQGEVIRQYVLRANKWAVRASNPNATISQYSTSISPRLSMDKEQFDVSETNLNKILAKINELITESDIFNEMENQPGLITIPENAIVDLQMKLTIHVSNLAAS